MPIETSKPSSKYGRVQNAPLWSFSTIRFPQEASLTHLSLAILKPYVKRVHADLLVTKSVNSAFYGTPDLNQWLKSSDIHQIVIIGIQTNMCCETTARMAGNLGYDVIFVPDAMHTFDATGPDGVVISADAITRATVASLFDGEFAKIASTEEIIKDGGK
jgi:isochorismate hydrolase